MYSRVCVRVRVGIGSQVLVDRCLGDLQFSADGLEMDAIRAQAASASAALQASEREKERGGPHGPHAPAAVTAVPSCRHPAEAVQL